MIGTRGRFHRNTQGVLGGVTEVGKKAVVDTYEALKAAIKKKLGEESDVVEAVEKLEQKPESEGRKAILAEEVADANLTKDEDLLQQAKELIAALKETPQGQEAVSKYNIQAIDSQIGIVGNHAKVKEIRFD